MHSREGSNIVIHTPDNRIIQTEGPYTDRMQIDQRLGPAVYFPDAQGVNRWPVLGVWMIDQTCSGMGIREDAGPITGNLSSFVPHRHPSGADAAWKCILLIIRSTPCVKASCTSA
jgi:glutathionylspermidine synthase